MQRLVRCPSCYKDYNTTGLFGGQFSCHCGSTVEIPTASFDHTADVVRCSSCGAPKGKESCSCAYCGSAYTLHEKDLDAVCPSCTHRVASKAKFCPHCGTTISQAESAAEITALPCPVCEDTKLFSRRLGQTTISVMECHGCLGYWLTFETFKELQKESVAEGAHILPLVDKNQSKIAASTQDGVNTSPGKAYYRKCPVCKALMNRKNMAKELGIIVDICQHHGVWFDIHELSSLMLWFKDGGYAKSQARALEDSKFDERERKFRQQNSKGDYFERSQTNDLRIELVDVAKIFLKLLN